MTGSASRKPRLAGGVEGRSERRTLPNREPPPFGRGASLRDTRTGALIFFKVMRYPVINHFDILPGAG
jgi:hypothetical protein